MLQLFPAKTSTWDKTIMQSNLACDLDFHIKLKSCLCKEKLSQLRENYVLENTA